MSLFILWKCKGIFWCAELLSSIFHANGNLECQNECVKVSIILTYYVWHLIDCLHCQWSQNRGSTTGHGPWSWYCLYFIQLKFNTVWISAHSVNHYINESFAQAVGGEMHSRLVSILSWITSTYRSAVECGMKMKSGAVSRAIIE